MPKQRAYNVRLFCDKGGLTVEVWRHGRRWIEHRHVSIASWNRLLYVLKGHGRALTPYQLRFTHEPETPDGIWYLDAWLHVPGPGQGWQR